MHSIGNLQPDDIYSFIITHKIYQGRSINKLQNGAIPSVLKIGKIRNICFVGNLILNIHTTSR